MAATKPKTDKKKKELSPNHVKHLRTMMNMARDPSAMSHPLLVPPAGVPAQGNVTQQVGGDDQLIPAKTGEYVIPEPVVRAKGTQFFDNLIKKTLQESLPPEAADEAEQKAGTGTPETGFRWGGEIPERGMYKQLYLNKGNDQGWSPQPQPQMQTQPNRSGWSPQPQAQTNYQQVGTPTEGHGPGTFAVNPSLFYGDNFSPSGSGFPDIRGGGVTNRAYLPNILTQVGMPWSPTMIPTTYDPQGFPYGVPVLSPDSSNSGPHPHTPPKHDS